jgi:hypothetical protein
VEREKEIAKLANVLRRIARGADYAAWNQSQPDAAQFCAMQYNKVLARLTELEPAIAPLVAPLAETASPQLVGMAARELAAYFAEDQPRRESRRARHGCRARVY